MQQSNPVWLGGKREHCQGAMPSHTDSKLFYFCTINKLLSVYLWLQPTKGHRGKTSARSYLKFFLAGAASEKKIQFSDPRNSPLPHPNISSQTLSQEKTPLLTTTTYPVVLVLVVLGQPLFKRREVFPEGSCVHFGGSRHDLHHLLPGLRLAEPQHLQQLRSGEFAAWNSARTTRWLSLLTIHRANTKVLISCHGRSSSVCKASSIKVPQRSAT